MRGKGLGFVLLCLNLVMNRAVAGESETENQGNLFGITFTQRHADAAKVFVDYLFSYGERHSESQISATKEDTKIEETIPVVRQKNVVRVGIFSDCFPFTFKQKNDPAGFEVDLMKLIAEEESLICEFQYLEAMEINQKFNDKTIDVALGAWLRDEAVEKIFEFSNGYLNTDLGVVIQKKPRKNPSEKLSFIGKKIGVLENTYLENYIRLAHIQNTEIVTFESTAAMLGALLSGQQQHPLQEKEKPLDLVLIDKNTAQHWIAKNPELEYISLNMAREYAFCVAKGSPFLETINCGMNKVLGTQKFMELKRRWSIDEN
jgi:ABC-type amino acid transport substrate-binding protein